MELGSIIEHYYRAVHYKSRAASAGQSIIQQYSIEQGSTL